jgi:Tfp pilus assembly protein PilF
MEAEFMLQRGVVALGEGNVTNAKQYFESSMNLQPDNLFLKADIAKESLSEPVLLPFADSIINFCLTIDPSNAKFMAINGRVLCEKGAFLLAKTWLEKAIVNGYPEQFGEEWLGDCAYKNGDPIRAKLHWLNAISSGNQSGRIIEKLKNL